METPRERHERGLAMMAVTNADFADLAYLRKIEAALSEEDLERFREKLFSEECRGMAGIRPAAELAIRKIKEEDAKRFAGDIVKDTWRSEKQNPTRASGAQSRIGR